MTDEALAAALRLDPALAEYLRAMKPAPQSKPKRTRKARPMKGKRS